MFNILTNDLPNEINGIKIKTSYRNVMKLEEIMEDSTLTKEEKVGMSILIFFDDKEIISNSPEKLAKAMIDFYMLGEEIEEKDERVIKKEVKESKKIYSFKQDAGYIYSSFLQQYNIDLIKEKELHWLQFKALFSSLSEDTKMGEIMKYRAINISKIKDKEERKFYQKQKRIYAIKSNKSKEELENEFHNLFD